MGADTVHYEVAYAKPEEQLILGVDGPPAMTLRQAIEASGILARFPEIDLASAAVGVFGRLAELDSALCPGDRVEIYRALIADPKETRKQRAAKKKTREEGSDPS